MVLFASNTTGVVESHDITEGREVVADAVISRNRGDSPAVHPVSVRDELERSRRCYRNVGRVEDADPLVGPVHGVVGEGTVRGGVWPKVRCLCERQRGGGGGD